MERPKNANRYSFEVKKQVVERLAAGEPKVDLAKEFGIDSVRSITRWAKAWREGGDEALKGRRLSHDPECSCNGSATDNSNKELDLELERLRAENAILKKLRDLGR